MGSQLRAYSRLLCVDDATGSTLLVLAAAQLIRVRELAPRWRPRRA